jgi:mono/diheme cytochrome c family protein
MLKCLRPVSARRSSHAEALPAAPADVRAHRHGRSAPSALAIGLALVAALAGSGCGASAEPSGPSGAGLIARGRLLYKDDGCSSCHSLNGSRLAGPTFAGLADSTVKLANGTTARATNAFVMRQIVGAEKATVQGYPPALMEQATALLGLEGKPQDVRALAAFIQTVR